MWHETDTRQETCRQRWRFRPQYVKEKSPVEHHCAFGILCCLLFHLFLFTPVRDREKKLNNNSHQVFMRTIWRDDAWNSTRTKRWKDGGLKWELGKETAWQWRRKLWVSVVQHWAGVSLPAVREDFQRNRGRHLQRLPGQVLVDQLLGPSGQRPQWLLERKKAACTHKGSGTVRGAV